MISSCGTGLIAIAVILFLINVYVSSLLRSGKMADNPWDAARMRRDGVSNAEVTAAVRRRTMRRRAVR